MNELGIQSMLMKDFCKAFHDSNPLAYKQNNRFLTGVPDLRLAAEGFGDWNIEVKYLSKMPRSEVTKLDMTPLQRKWGRQMLAAGLNWGWCLVIADPTRGVYHVLAGGDPGQEKVYTHDRLSYRRGINGRWNDYRLIDQMQSRAK